MTADETRRYIEGEIEKELSRRHFLKLAGVGAMAAGLSGSLLAACSKPAPTTAVNNAGATGGDSLRIGVVAPFSGIGAFIGTIVNNSLQTAVKQLNSTGGLGGRKVELLIRDTGVDPANGPKAYTDIASDSSVVGIVWCGGAGLLQTLPQIKRDGFPLIAAFNDLESAGHLYPKGQDTGRSVFQMLIPGVLEFDLLADYAKNDRGYTSAALITDTTTDPESENPKYFKAALEKYGLANKGIETFSVTDSDYGPQLQRIKAAKPQTIWIWGLSSNSAGIVKQLAALDASYVDTPTAKGPTWHPHVFGSGAGTGDKSWIELAGPPAKVGTVTAWHVGGLLYLPDYPFAGWMQKYLGKHPTGGEETPADGLYTLLQGIKKAGSTDRQKVVQGIETMGKIKFASIDFSFDSQRHVNKTRDDMILVTMERGAQGPAPTDPAYKLGAEWNHLFTDTPAGPTHLVRPTLAANQGAHPDVMSTVLKGGWGTQCTKHADGTLGTECKIH
jgi:branched-chain amino acid transport system substrate-binding protein